MRVPGIAVENFGPFEYADLELRYLTILIGRNSVGKSMLSYLVWALAVSQPNFEILGDLVTERGADEMAREVLSEVQRGLNPREKIRDLIRLHIEVLPEALVPSLKEILQKTFMANLRELIREGAERSTIRVRGPCAELTVVLEDDGIKITNHKMCAEALDEIDARVVRPNKVRIIYPGGREYEESITGVSDLVILVMKALAFYMVRAFGPFFTAPELVPLLPDSRAGILRVLLKPYISPAVAKTIPYTDEQFVGLYYRLAECVERGLVRLDWIRPLLEELGCTLDVVFEKGVYTLYIRTWSGKRLPISQAPSGIRESLVVALALASEEGPYIVIIEEPESHLHPRAQRVLARLIARSVNELRKIVLITTHSDYMLYTINDLIALSKHPEKVRELGFLRSEALDPSQVAAYLVKAEGRKAVLTGLGITDEGIPEDEFAQVAEELARERARIMA